MRKVLLCFLLAIILGTLLLVKYFGPWETNKHGPTIHIYFAAEGKTANMYLEDYLVGVLAAEMPAEFEIEALKAQAIAARTYALKKIKAFQGSGNKVHPKAEICSDPSHCQGWLSAKEMKAKWGWLKSWEYERKLKLAVRETAGEVAKFQQDLIDPVYHSTCGGQTENAEEVWTYSVSYLKSVPCSWDRQSPKFESSLIIPLTDFNKKLDLNIKATDFSSKTLQILSKTATGRVKTLSVSNKVFSATDFRRRLSLNSTNFTWNVTNEGIIFQTIGYGHGVGMCQYGANGLAQKGYRAENILKHYFPGIKVEKMY
ncbi:MAG: stage II sporulation protein D [Dehalobacterium sp.]